MSLSSRQLVSTASRASKRVPALTSIGQSTPTARLRTRSTLPRPVTSSRPTTAARATSGLAPRYYASVPHAAPFDAALEAKEPIPSISPQDTYDIVIIGAGNAGLALAASLLSKEHLLSNRRVLLVEGGKLDRVRNWKGTEHLENRVSSITAENVEFLKSIGAWQHIERSRSCPVKDMLVWTSSGSTSSRIDFPATRSPMAYMTENTNLQRALLRRIAEAGEGKVVIREEAKVQEMRMDEGKRSVALQLGDGGWVRGGVVVGADGPNSPVRKFSGIESFGHAYPTHGIVATLEHSRLDANHTAFQRFLPTGPLAFLPMTPTSSTMVWSTKPELVAAYKALGSEALAHLVNLGLYASEQELERLNAAILGEGVSTAMIEAESQRVMSTLTNQDVKSLPPPIMSIAEKSIASFPYRLSHAESYLGERTALVGDAAHTVHPLAGQGLNMGLADVRALAETWDRVGKVGGDLGAYTAMLPYSKERYPANHLLLSTTDKLHHVFGTRIPIVNWARSTGMDLINELTPVKRALMERVGGNAGAAGEKQKTWYETGADSLDGWRTVKSLAGIARAGAGQLIGNAARKFVERGTSISASAGAGTRSIHTSARVAYPKPKAPPIRRQGPMPLPRKEQAEFDALVKAAQGPGVSLDDARAQARADSTKGASKSPASNADVIAHRDLRKTPRKQFEGEVNPMTGEVGGPKRDPFQAGDGDWQYSGRVTDF